MRETPATTPVHAIADEAKSLLRRARRALPGVGAPGVKMDSLGRRWNPALHPRDSRGRFIETGGIARIGGGGGKGRIVRVLPGGKVVLRMANGSRREMAAAKLTMLRRPDGTKPTDSRTKVSAEDARRTKSPKRGDGVKKDDLGDRDKDGVPDKVDATPDGKPVAKKKPAGAAGQGPAKGAAKKPGKEPRDAGHGFKIVDTKVEQGQNATTGDRDLYDPAGNHIATVTETPERGPKRFKGKVGDTPIYAANEQAWVDQAKPAYLQQRKGGTFKPTGKANLDGSRPTPARPAKAAPEARRRDTLDVDTGDSQPKAAADEQPKQPIGRVSPTGTKIIAGGKVVSEEYGDEGQIELGRVVSDPDRKGKNYAIAADGTKLSGGSGTRSAAKDALVDYQNGESVRPYTRKGEKPGRPVDRDSKIDGIAARHKAARDRAARENEMAAREGNRRAAERDAAQGDPEDSRAVQRRKESQASAARSQEVSDRLAAERPDWLEDRGNMALIDRWLARPSKDGDGTNRERIDAAGITRKKQVGDDGYYLLNDDGSQSVRVPKDVYDRHKAPDRGDTDTDRNKREQAREAAREQQQRDADTRDVSRPDDDQVQTGDDDQSTTDDAEEANRDDDEPAGVDAAGREVLDDVPAVEGGGDERGFDLLPGPGADDAGRGRGSRGGRGGRGSGSAAGDGDAPGAGRRPARRGGRGVGDGAEGERAAAPGAGDRGPADAGDDDAGLGRRDELTPAPRFKPQGQGDLAPKGEAAKLAANLAALRLLRELDREDRTATADEQSVLARWAGWGSLPKVFDEDDTRFAAERAELRDLLGDAEYRAARRNTLNAHYTDAAIVEPMWDTLADLGFDRGDVLEPGSGSGNFIGLAPGGARMTGVELDPTTANLSQHLYPDAEIYNEGFQHSPFRNDSFDAVVGNVPFGNFSLRDPEHNPGRRESIHNHFILKSLAKLKPGGTMAMVTSQFTMDSTDSTARRRMFADADLIGSVRLPANTHRDAAGTSVVTDVLLFRKRKDGEAPGDASWLETVPALDRNGDPVLNVKGQPQVINKRYVDRPEDMLGDLRSGGYNGHELVAEGNTHTRLRRQLALAVAEARADGRTHNPDPDGPDEKPRRIPPTAMEGRIEAAGEGVDDKGKKVLKFTRNEDGKAVEHEVPATQQDEVRRLLDLRERMRNLLALESDEDATDDEIEDARAALNRAYDEYVGKYGPLTRFTWSSKPNAKSGEYTKNRPQMGGFRTLDSSWPELAALEKSYTPVEKGQKGKGTATKADLLTKRQAVPAARREQLIDEPDDAVASLEEAKEAVTWEAIAERMGVDVDVARKVAAGSVFTDPDNPDRLVPRAAYLSDNVRAKLRHVEGLLADDPDNADLRRNRDALLEVLPADAELDEIPMQLGAGWIPPEIINEFANDLMEVPQSRREYGVKVLRDHTGLWHAPTPRVGGSWTLQTETWGTDRKNFYELLTSVLRQNGNNIKVTDKGPDGERVLNQEATDAAREKAAEIAARWESWAFERPDMAEALSTAYTEALRSRLPREYAGSPKREMPGSAKHVDLRPYQNDAVTRIVHEPAVLLDHVVGAGKTYTMAGGIMELRRLGMVKKPVLVVPQHMIDQWSREFREMYPNAKLLTADGDAVSPKNRKKFAALARNNDWDAVIMTPTAFQAVPVSPDYEERYLRREIDRLLEAKAKMQAREDEGDRGGPTVKDVEKTIQEVEEAIEDAVEARKDHDGIDFESIGFDYIAVDEAHSYKNLHFVTRMPGVQSPPRVKKTIDMHMKMGLLRENAGPDGKIATWATGTPVSNSLAEMWAMTEYLRPDMIEEADMRDFDSWAATLATTSSKMELNTAGDGFQLRTRMRGFTDALGDGMRFWRTFADTVTADDMAVYVQRPKVKGGDRKMHVVPMSEAQVLAKDSFRERVDMLPPGRPEKGQDGHLAIIGDGRRNAIDPRLMSERGRLSAGIDKDEDLGPSPKITAMADQIADIYARTKDAEFTVSKRDKTPAERRGAMQMVMGDSSVEAYDLLVDALVARGIPADMIRTSREAKTPDDKARLFKEANDGKVAVLIGSTDSLGTGTNVQNRLYALHHMDASWKPSDIEQREGRILRQGNQYDEVELHVYATENTHDVKTWDMIAYKQQGIDQIKVAGYDSRAVDFADDEDPLKNFDAIAGAGSGNVLIVERREIEAEVGKLRKSASRFKDSMALARKQAEAFADREAAARGRALRLRKAAAEYVDTRGDKFALTMGDREFTDRAAAGEALLAGARSRVDDRTINTYPQRLFGSEFTLGGIDGRIKVYRDKDKKFVAEVELATPGQRPGEEPNLPVTPLLLGEDELKDAGGVIGRIESRLQDLEGAARREDARAERSAKEAADQRAVTTGQFKGAEDLLDAENTLSVLNKLLGEEYKDANEKALLEDEYERLKNAGEERRKAAKAARAASLAAKKQEKAQAGEAARAKREVSDAERAAEVEDRKQEVARSRSARRERAAAAGAAVDRAAASERTPRPSGSRRRDDSDRVTVDREEVETDLVNLGEDLPDRPEDRDVTPDEAPDAPDEAVDAPESDAQPERVSTPGSRPERGSRAPRRPAQAQDDTDGPTEDAVDMDRAEVETDLVNLGEDLPERAPEEPDNLLDAAIDSGRLVIQPVGAPDADRSPLSPAEQRRLEFVAATQTARYSGAGTPDRYVAEAELRDLVDAHGLDTVRKALRDHYDANPDLLTEPRSVQDERLAKHIEDRSAIVQRVRDAVGAKDDTSALAALDELEEFEPGYVFSNGKSIDAVRADIRALAKPKKDRAARADTPDRGENSAPDAPETTDDGPKIADGSGQAGALDGQTMLAGDGLDMEVNEGFFLTQDAPPPGRGRQDSGRGAGGDDGPNLFGAVGEDEPADQWERFALPEDRDDLPEDRNRLASALAYSADQLSSNETAAESWALTHASEALRGSEDMTFEKLNDELEFITPEAVVDAMADLGGMLSRAGKDPELRSGKRLSEWLRDAARVLPDAPRPDRDGPELDLTPRTPDAPKATDERWNIAGLRNPGTHSDKGKSRLAQALRSTGTTDDNDKAALVFAADALTDPAWARGGGPAGTGKELADLDADQLALVNMSREDVDARMQAVSDLADELDRLGHSNIKTAQSNGRDMPITDYLRAIADAYRAERTPDVDAPEQVTVDADEVAADAADLASTDAPEAPEVPAAPETSAAPEMPATLNPSKVKYAQGDTVRIRGGHGARFDVVGTSKDWRTDMVRLSDKDGDEFDVPAAVVEGSGTAPGRSLTGERSVIPRAFPGVNDSSHSVGTYKERDQDRPVFVARDRLTGESIVGRVARVERRANADGQPVDLYSSKAVASVVELEDGRKVEVPEHMPLAAFNHDQVEHAYEPDFHSRTDAINAPDAQESWQYMLDRYAAELDAIDSLTEGERASFPADVDVDRLRAQNKGYYDYVVSQVPEGLDVTAREVADTPPWTDRLPEGDFTPAAARLDPDSMDRFRIDDDKNRRTIVRDPETGKFVLSKMDGVGAPKGKPIGTYDTLDEASIAAVGKPAILTKKRRDALNALTAPVTVDRDEVDSDRADLDLPQTEAPAPAAPPRTAPVNPGPPPERVLTTPGALNLLKELVGREGDPDMSPDAVDLTGLNPTATKKALDDGLITRVEAPEGRTGRYASLTDKGRAVLAYDEWREKQDRWSTSPEARDAAIRQAQEEAAGQEFADQVRDLAESTTEAPEAPAKPAKAKKPLKRDEVTFHESYGDVSRGQLAAYRKHNVSPATHDALVDHYGEDQHEAIRQAVMDPENHAPGSTMFEEYRWAQRVRDEDRPSILRPLTGDRDDDRGRDEDRDEAPAGDPVDAEDTVAPDGDDDQVGEEDAPLATPEPVEEPAPAADADDTPAPAPFERAEKYAWARKAIEGEEYDPTAQQADVYESVLDGKDVLVQAKAGAGKTSTLEGLARRLEQDDPSAKVLYIAFNKTVQLEAEGRMPANVEPVTGHAIGRRFVGRAISEKRDRKGMLVRPEAVARHLGIREPMPLKDGAGEPLTPTRQAQGVMSAVRAYAKSADDNISPAHLPERFRQDLDEASQDALVGFAEAAWADLKSPDGKLKPQFDDFRKMWALSRPDLSKPGVGIRAATHVFLDEAQDTPPVLAKVLADQGNVRKVIVGDADQAIYGFTGAIDYLSTAKADRELPLTKSWRFGPEVADAGNRFLQVKGSRDRVEGGGGPSRIVDGMDDADAVLVRSNGGMLTAVADELDRGRKVGVTKGTKKDLQKFVDTARYLQGNGDAPDTMHEDLEPYLTWDEVKKAADEDRKLSMLVKLDERFGVDGIKNLLDQIIEDFDPFEGVTFDKDDTRLVLTGKTYQLAKEVRLATGGRMVGNKVEGGDTLSRFGFRYRGSDQTWTVRGDDAAQRAALDRVRALLGGKVEDPDVTISTAHKAKGLEWDRVRIGDDFPQPKVDPDTGDVIYPDDTELMLDYVAVTRAQKDLDLGSLAWVLDHTTPNGGRPGDRPGRDRDVDAPEAPAAAREDRDAPEAPDDAPEAPQEAEETVTIDADEVAADAAAIAGDGTPIGDLTVGDRFTWDGQRWEVDEAPAPWAPDSFSARPLEGGGRPMSRVFDGDDFPDGRVQVLRSPAERLTDDEADAEVDALFGDRTPNGTTAVGDLEMGDRFMHDEQMWIVHEPASTLDGSILVRPGDGGDSQDDVRQWTGDDVPDRVRVVRADDNGGRFDVGDLKPGDRFEANVVDADGEKSRRSVRFHSPRKKGMIRELNVFDAETGEPLIARVPAKHPVDVDSRDGDTSLPPRGRPIDRPKTEADWQDDAREHNNELLDRLASDLDVQRGGRGGPGLGQDLFAPGTETRYDRKAKRDVRVKQPPLPDRYRNMLLNGHGVPAVILAKHLPEESTLGLWGMHPSELRAHGMGSRFGIPGAVTAKDMKRLGREADGRDPWDDDDSDPHGFREDMDRIIDLDDDALEDERVRTMLSDDPRFDTEDGEEYHRRLVEEQARRAQMDDDERDSDRRDRARRAFERFNPGAEWSDDDDRGRRGRRRNERDGDGLDGDGLDGPDGLDVPDGPGRDSDDDDSDDDDRPRGRRGRRRRRRGGRRGRNERDGGGRNRPGGPGWPHLPGDDDEGRDEGRNPRDRGPEDAPASTDGTVDGELAARDAADQAPGASEDDPRMPWDDAADEAVGDFAAAADDDGTLNGETFGQVADRLLAENGAVLDQRLADAGVDNDWLDATFGPGWAGMIRAGDPVHADAVNAAVSRGRMTEDQLRALFGLTPDGLAALRGTRIRVPGTRSMRDVVDGDRDGRGDRDAPRPVVPPAGTPDDVVNTRADAAEDPDGDEASLVPAGAVLPGDRVVGDGDESWDVVAVEKSPDGRVEVDGRDEAGTRVRDEFDPEDQVPVHKESLSGALGADEDDDEAPTDSSGEAAAASTDGAAPEATTPAGTPADSPEEAFSTVGGGGSPRPGGADTRTRTRTGRVNADELRVGDVIDAKRTDGTEGPLTVQSVRRNGYRDMVTGTDPDGRTVYASLNEHGAKIEQGMPDGTPAAFGADVPETSLGDQAGSTLPGDLRVGDVIDGTVLRESTGPGLRTSKRIPARLRITGPSRTQGGFRRFPVERVDNDGTPTGERFEYSIPGDRPVNVRSRAGEASTPPASGRPDEVTTPDPQSQPGAGEWTDIPGGGLMASSSEDRWVADVTPNGNGDEHDWSFTIPTAEAGLVAVSGTSPSQAQARRDLFNAVQDAVIRDGVPQRVLDSPAISGGRTTDRDGRAPGMTPGSAGSVAPRPGARTGSDPVPAGDGPDGDVPEALVDVPDGARTGDLPGDPDMPSADTPRPAGGRALPVPGRRRPSQPTPDPDRPVPTEDPADVGGRRAQWRPVESITGGDLVRAEGTTPDGARDVASGFAVGPPVPVGVTRDGSRTPEFGWMVTTTANPDGTGDRRSVLTGGDALVAYAPPATDGGEVDGGARTRNALDVLADRLPDKVPTGNDGTPLFPGALVRDHNGNEGIVVGATDRDVAVQWESGDVSETIAPTAVRVTEPAPAIPSGWDDKGRRIAATDPAADRGRANVTKKPAKQVTDGDVVLLPGAGGELFPATVVTAADRDGKRRLTYADMRDGEVRDVDVDPGEALTVVNGDLVTEDHSTPDVEVEAYTPITPVDDIVATGGLLPSHRRTINGLGFDLDPMQPEDVAQGAARLRDRRGITQGQATALANAVRASGNDRDRGSAADALDAIAASLRGDSGPAIPRIGGGGEGTVVGMRSLDQVAEGDKVAVPGPDGKAVAGTLTRRTEVAPGVFQLDVAGPDGTITQTLPGDAQVMWLGKGEAPKVDVRPDDRTTVTQEARKAAEAQTMVYGRAIGDDAAAALEGTTGIHQAREAVAARLSEANLKQVTGRAAQRWYDDLTRSGLVNDADRAEYLAAADARRQAVETAVRAAIVDTLNTTDPIPGESWEDTQDRMRRLIREAAMDAAESTRDRLSPPDYTDGPSGRAVQSSLFEATDAAARAAVDAIPANAPSLTPEEVHRLMAAALGRAGLSSPSVRRRVADRMLDRAGVVDPEERRTILGRLMSALARLAKRVGAWLKAALGAFKESMSGAAWRRRGGRLMRKLRSMMAGTPEWAETQRLLRRGGGDDLGMPSVGDGPDMPGPGEFGLRMGSALQVTDAGDVPDVTEQMVPDVAPDGGPGERTLAHLDRVTGAGQAADERVRIMVDRALTDVGGIDGARQAVADADAAEAEWRRTGSEDAAALAQASRLAADTVSRRAAAAHAKAFLADAKRRRPMGSTREAHLSFKGGSTEQHRALRWAQQFVPTEWLAAVADKPIRLEDDDHGWYDPATGRMAIADLGETVDGQNGYARSAMHEMWHHLEAHVPDLQRAQAAYHFRRTSTGEVGSRERVGRNKSVTLADLFPGRGFTRDDRTREDGFSNPYAGTEYANGQAWELLTTAAEELFAGDGWVDDDLRYFMLGMLEKLAVNEKGGRR